MFPKKFWTWYPLQHEVFFNANRPFLGILYTPFIDLYSIKCFKIWIAYFFLRRDINHYLKSVKEEEHESKRINRLLNDLEQFLEKERVKEKQNKAIEVSKMLEEGKKK